MCLANYVARGAGGDFGPHGPSNPKPKRRETALVKWQSLRCMGGFCIFQFIKTSPMESDRYKIRPVACENRKVCEVKKS